MHKIIRFLKELTISIHHIPKSEVYIFLFHNKPDATWDYLFTRTKKPHDIISWNL